MPFFLCSLRMNRYSSCCTPEASPFWLGQSMLATVAIHTARNSRLGGVFWENAAREKRKRRNGIRLRSFMENGLLPQDIESTPKLNFAARPKTRTGGASA